MPGRKQKPDHTSVRQDWDYLSALWGPAHAHWKELDSYYWRTFKIWPPEVESSRSDIRPSRPTNVIDHLTAALAAFTISGHRIPAGEGEEHQRHSDLMEPWIEDVFNEASLREPLMTWMQLGKHMAQYGYGVVEGPLWDTKGAPIEPERNDGESETAYRNRIRAFSFENETEFPIRISSPHPARVLLDPREKNPELAIKRYRITEYDLEYLTMTKSRTRKNSIRFEREQDGNPYKTVEVTEVWTRYWHGLFGPKDAHYVEKNTWGYLPFDHAYSGQGMEQTDQTEYRTLPLSKGFLTPVMEVIKSEAQLRSAQQEAVIRAAFFRRGTQRDPSDVAETLQNPDAWLEGPKSDYWTDDMPNYPAWFLDVGRDLGLDIEDGTFSKVLAGERPVGVSTVGQHAILSTAAAQTLGQIRKRIEHLATGQAMKVLRLVDQIGKSVTINRRTVGPEQIHHNYNMRMQFRLTDPVLKLQEAQHFMNEFQAGLISAEDYYSATGKEDSTGIRNRLFEQELRKLPAYQFRAMAILAERDGMNQLALELEQAAQQAQAGDAQNLISSVNATQQNGGGQVGDLRSTLTDQDFNPNPVPLRGNNNAGRAGV